MQSLVSVLQLEIPDSKRDGKYIVTPDIMSYDIVSKENNGVLTETQLRSLKTRLFTIVMGKFISFISVILVLASSCTYATFWTIVSRLLTDPNYITIQTGYTKADEMNDTNAGYIYLVSILIICIEFYRNYLTVVGIPLGVTFFAGFLASAREPEKPLYYKYYSVLISVFVSVCSCILAFASILGLFSADIYNYNNANGENLPLKKLGVGFAGLFACFLQVFCWYICWLCFESFKKPPETMDAKTPSDSNTAPNNNTPSTVLIVNSRASIGSNQGIMTKRSSVVSHEEIELEE